MATAIADLFLTLVPRFLWRAWTIVHPRLPFPSTRVLRVQLFGPDLKGRKPNPEWPRKNLLPHGRRGRTPPWMPEHVKRSMKDFTLDAGAYQTLHDDKEGLHPGCRSMSNAPWTIRQWMPRHINCPQQRYTDKERLPTSKTVSGLKSLFQLVTTS
jgi:hypothetical protein